MGKNMLQKLNRLRGTIRYKVTRLSKTAESYEPPATTEESEIILNQKLQNVLELKAQIKKLLADYLDLPESANLEESLDIICIMEEEIDDLKCTEVTEPEGKSHPNKSASSIPGTDHISMQLDYRGVQSLKSSQCYE
ncbi:hypothetical protein AVEN_232929-1, partial [Araneus ventricosus]